jgi:hypothetical protein
MKRVEVDAQGHFVEPDSSSWVYCEGKLDLTIDDKRIAWLGIAPGKDYPLVLELPFLLKGTCHA